MQRFVKLLFAVALAVPLAAPPAFAHAILDHAVPGVRTTVSGPVREIRISFNQGVVTAFSHVHVVSAAGAQIPVGKPVNAGQETLVVRLGPPARTGNLLRDPAGGLGRHAYNPRHF